MQVGRRESGTKDRRSKIGDRVTVESVVPPTPHLRLRTLCGGAGRNVEATAETRRRRGGIEVRRSEMEDRARVGPMLDIGWGSAEEMGDGRLEMADRPPNHTELSMLDGRFVLPFSFYL